MKIVSESPTVLVAKDSALGALFAAPMVALIGLLIIGVGISQKSFPAIIFGVLFFLVSVLLVVTRKARTLTIDKDAGTVILNVASMRKKQDLRYQVTDVVKMQLTSEYHTQYANNNAGGMPGSGINIGVAGLGSSNTNTTQQTQLLIQMRDGTSIDIADGSRSMGAMSMISKVPNQEIGEHIAAFLGVQFEVVGPNMPTLGSVVAGVQGMIHHNDAAPSVVPQQPVVPAPTQPAPPAGLDAPGFAMPHATPISPTTPIKPAAPAMPAPTVVPAAAAVAAPEPSVPAPAVPSEPVTTPASVVAEQPQVAEAASSATPSGSSNQQ